MAEPRPEKVAEVEALEARLRASQVVILTDYRGLTVAEIAVLRSRLRDNALEYRVAKNTLLSRAAEGAGVRGLDSFLVGPTAVVFGRDDPGVPARVLQEFIRQYRKLEIKGGVVEGETLDSRAVQALAFLPSRPELLSRVVGAVQGPLRGLVTVLSGPARGLVTALEALRKEREKTAVPDVLAPPADFAAGQHDINAVGPEAGPEPAAAAPEPAAAAPEPAAVAPEPAAAPDATAAGPAAAPPGSAAAAPEPAESAAAAPEPAAAPDTIAAEPAAASEAPEPAPPAGGAASKSD